MTRFGQVIVLAAFVSALTIPLNAQNTFPSSGDVGIGTASPGAPLQLENSLLSTSSYWAGSTIGQTLISDAPTATSGTYISNIMLLQPTTATASSASYYTNVTDLTVPSSSTGTYADGLLADRAELSYQGTGNVTGTLTGLGAYAENKSASANVATIFGVDAVARNIGSGSTTTLYGGFFNATANSSGTTGTVTNEYGVLAKTYCSNTNTCTNMYGIYAYSDNIASTTTTNAYGGYFDFGTLNGTPTTGTVTNGYGVYIGTMAGTSKYSLYAADNTAPSYFAGSVGIGVHAPAYPLSVKGTIGAGEVVVTNTSGWSDYVFDPNYRLAPLDDVAAYIKDNHHLPEIPSAKEVAEKGVGLGEMQAKLLAKIEELTLHMIQAEKDRDLLMQRNQELQDRVERLEAASTAK